MPRFRIIYNDPETGEECLIVRKFRDDDIAGHFIPASMWAADYAYSLADKGWYDVQEIK